MNRRLRLSLGWREVDIIDKALGFYLDNWRDSDDEMEPWERESLARAVRAIEHIRREKTTQKFRY